MLMLGRKDVLSAYLAIAVSVACYFRSQPPRVFFNGSNPKPPLPTSLTLEQVDSYHRDGYLLIRGFVSDPKELAGLVKTGTRIQSTFSILDMFFKELYTKLRFNQWRAYPEFASLVFESSLPSISAQLLDEKNSIRLMKDALFAQNAQTRGCGWHVDDYFFWPATSNGVTAWLALSNDMKTLRLAPGSHRESWSLPCREAIVNAPNATCSMDKVHPECNAMLDKIAVSFDVQAGDMLLWDRWLFHRSEVMGTNDPKARYSVRFIPQGAKVREGVTSAHPSVKVGEEFHGAYYPQVWPSALSEEVDAIHKGLEGDTSPLTLTKILWGFVVSKWRKSF